MKLRIEGVSLEVLVRLNEGGFDALTFFLDADQDHVSLVRYPERTGKLDSQHTGKYIYTLSWVSDK